MTNVYGMCNKVVSTNILKLRMGLPGLRKHCHENCSPPLWFPLLFSFSYFFIWVPSCQGHNKPPFTSYRYHHLFPHLVTMVFLDSLGHPHQCQLYEAIARTRRHILDPDATCNYGKWSLTCTYDWRVGTGHQMKPITPRSFMEGLRWPPWWIPWLHEQAWYAWTFIRESAYSASSQYLVWMGGL